eukprot:CAMPEP_0174298000 /NCGR_PEP_ID=MMETSP0809-20121228/52570_1 /TAXON_ID=73025 ORGANISM="Eutreptiella gymnastica-like, Strain CCMP1594" /NCGR_SAMPLE_ID=MMETSP0809 /ASSEMBLY_ACC=CAM_ASM_000658 /LENGTH=84 /DNA_ID=CAMNT_0015402167 /DNA_START=293 /DNA_END=547 /DNA_ORIENTATION=+
MTRSGPVHTTADQFDKSPLNKQGSTTPPLPLQAPGHNAPSGRPNTAGDKSLSQEATDRRTRHGDRTKRWQTEAVLSLGQPVLTI